MLTGCAAAPTATAPATPTVVGTLELSDPQSWPGDLKIPLHASGPYRYADVALNGSQVGRFLFDTGANRTVVDNGRANRLGLPDDGGGTTTGIAGQTQTRYRRAEQLALKASTTDAEARYRLHTGPARMIAMDMQKLGGMHGGTGGILGFRGVDAVPFTFNPADASLTLHRPDTFRPPAGTTRARLHRFHGLPVVEAELFGRDDDRVKVRFILDTGMNTSVSLPHTVLQQHPAVASVPVTGSGNSRGVGGTLASNNTWLKKTRMFGLDLRHLPVSFEPMPAQLQPRTGPPQGRIGMAVLAHFELTFDARRGYVYARYLGESSKAGEQ